MAKPSIDPGVPRDPLGDNPSSSVSPEQSPDSAGFWRHKSLDELIAEQGVRPIDDFQGFLDKISDFWPEEESADEFIAWLAETRRRG
jgi:hypothetical protein